MALAAEFTVGEGELMAHDAPWGAAPDEHHDLALFPLRVGPDLYLKQVR